MSDRGYDSLSRDDAKSMSEQFNNQPPSKRLFAAEIKGLCNACMYSNYIYINSV